MDKDYDDEDDVKIIRTKRIWESSRWILKKHAYRWNFSDIISTYSSIQRQKKSTLFYKRKGNTYGLIEPELD